MTTTTRRIRTAWLMLGSLCLLSAHAQTQSYSNVTYPRAIDFRDLFLTPSESQALNGSGLQPYGDVFHEFLWPVINEQSSMITDMIVGFTEEQSGQAGEIFLNTSLTFEAEDLQVTVSNLTVTGLDSLKVNSLLQPTNHPHVLSNNVSVQDLTLSLTLQIADNTTSVHNTVEVNIHIPQATFTFDLMILMDAYALYDFPISNLLEIPCWMNILMDTSNLEHDAMELQNFKVHLSEGISLQVTCVDCSPLMETFLPQLMGTLQGSLDNSTTVATDTLHSGPNTLITESIEQLLEDAVYNAWRLLELNEATAEAALMCPHHDDYDPNTTSVHDNATWGLDFELFIADVIDDTIDNLNTSSIELSRETFETALAFGLIGVETAATIAAYQYLEDYSNETFTPTVFIPPPNETDKYLNWTDLQAYPLLELAFDQINNIEPDLINDLLRNNVLDNETGTLTIPLNLEIDTGLGHVVEVYQVVIHDVDTITQLNLAVPLTAYQLRSELFWEHMKVEAHINISSARFQEETMILSTEAHQIGVVVDVLLPIDMEALGNVPLGGILQNQLDCLLAAAQNATITNLNVTIGSIAPITTEGYLSEPMTELVNQVGEDFERDYGENLSEAVPIFFQTTVREYLNDLIDDTVNSIEQDCSVVVPQPPGFVNFQDLFWEDTPYGQLFSSLYTYINSTFFNPEGVQVINDLIASATSSQSNTSGMLSFLTDLGTTVNTTFQVGTWAGVAAAKVSNVTISNLDSLGMPFRVLWPSEPHRLETNLTMGANDLVTNETQPLTISADITIAAADGEEMDIYNAISVSLGLTEMKIFIDIILKIAEVLFLNFPLKAAVDINCWALLIPPRQYSALSEAQDSKLPGIAFDGQFNYTNATVDLDCISCTSPLLPEMIERLYRIGDENSELIFELVNRFLEGDLLVDAISTAVDNSQGQCEHTPDTWETLGNCGPNNGTLQPSDGNSTELGSPGNWTGEGPPFGGNSTEGAVMDMCFGAEWAPETPEEDADQRNPNAKFFNWAFGSFSILVVVCFIVARICVYYKNKRWMESLPPQGLQFLQHIQDKELERDEYLDETMASLYQSMFIPFHIRIAVPIVIVVNMCLFVVGHLAITATMSVAVNFGGDHFTIHDLVSFTFGDGLRGTFENGGYEMAILLLIFGGIWPYFRCILSLVLWFTPPSVLSASIRGRMFLWIDAMNKLTVRDIFKFMVIIAIFFIYAGGPYIFSKGTGELYSLTILAWPGPALYCGITAMILSRASSRFLLDFHYRAVDGAREAYHNDRVGTIAKDSQHNDDSSVETMSLEKPISTAKLEQPISVTKMQTSSNPSIDRTRSTGSFNDSRPSVGSFNDSRPISEEQIREQVAGSSPEDSSGEGSEIPTRESLVEEQIREQVIAGTSPEDSSDEEIPTKESLEAGRSITLCGKQILLGKLGMILAILTGVMMLLVGVVFLPAVSIDLSSILELILESGTTYEQAISEYGVYSFICAVLLKARLALETVAEYVAVVFLLVLGVIAISATWFFVLGKWFKDIYRNGWRRLYPSLLEKDENKKKERNLVMMPSYLRLKATQYSTVYVLAYSIGIYQLGAVTIYAIHYFCNIMDTIYGAVAFAGLIQSTDGECWEAQMTQPHNIVVLFGCLAYLTFCFFEQLFLQRKLNVGQARKFLQELQAERAYQEQLALEQMENQKIPSRRAAAAGSKSVLNSTVSVLSEGWSNLESTDGDDSSIKSHDLDGQYIGDARFSFADPRYSFNDQFLQNEGSELSTISETEQHDAEGTATEPSPPPPVEVDCDDLAVDADMVDVTLEEDVPIAQPVEADCDDLAADADVLEEDGPIEFDV